MNFYKVGNKNAFFNVLLQWDAGSYYSIVAFSVLASNGKKSAKSGLYKNFQPFRIASRKAMIAIFRCAETYLFSNFNVLWQQLWHYYAHQFRGISSSRDELGQNSIWDLTRPKRFLWRTNLLTQDLTRPEQKQILPEAQVPTHGVKDWPDPSL